MSNENAVLKDVLVLGAGSAGLLIALGIKRKLEGVNVRVLRSPGIGIIGVGESTTPNVPRYLFEFLGIGRRRFYEVARPTWKLGLRFTWGPRPFFDYVFTRSFMLQDIRLPRAHAYYCENEWYAATLQQGLSLTNRVFARNGNGEPEIDASHAFHLENARFVQLLEEAAKSLNIELIDGEVTGVVKGPRGIAAVVLADSRSLAADFFVDASGFRRELIGKALNEPTIGFGKSLFNDRAIVGSWTRGPGDRILPYTTAETMNSGWSWQVEHQETVNRGYVYSSAHISEEEARREFAEKNPRAKLGDRVLKYETGRLERSWVDNVLAIGNAAGFVEPLEATGLMMICYQAETFCNMLSQVGPTEKIRDVYNLLMASAWDEIRDFLTLHFKINTRLNTPYWLHCREDADASRIKAMLEFYGDAGPTGFNQYNMHNRDSQFGIEGYLVQFVGNQVPYRNRHRPTAAELAIVTANHGANIEAAQRGFTSEEALAIVHNPGWQWFDEMQQSAARSAGRK
jgi:tryptophan halogenase